MKYSHFTVAIAIMSAAPALMAGYRVIDGAGQEVLPREGWSSPAQVEAIPPQKALQHDYLDRVRMLEAENIRLRMENQELRRQLQSRPHEASQVFEKATESVPFAFGRSNASLSQARKSLLLERASNASSIEIVGYTDNVGDMRVNKKIALARAQMVKDMLVKNGIPAEIISIREEAGTYHATNSTATGRAANRRAIVVFK